MLYQNTPPVRIAFICNQSFALKTLYRGLFPELAAHGFECRAVVGDRAFLNLEPEFFGNVVVDVVPMRREPSIFQDLLSLFGLVRYLARNRFDVLHVSTPKAALLGALAGRLTGHRKILFVVRTRIYEDRQGLARWVLEMLDALVCRLSDLVAPISQEMGRDMVERGLCPSRKIRYFGAGSSNGINVDRFARNAATIARGLAFRKAYGISESATVALFIGRLARGKGLIHLPQAVDALVASGADVKVVVAGPVDWREPTEPSVLAALESRQDVVRVPFQDDPVDAYAAADFLLFPSVREGFGNVALEAQAMELPVVGFNVPGVREAVSGGETGLLAAPGNTAAFAANAAVLATDTALRRAMGEAGRARVVAKFSHDRVWADLRAALRELAGDAPEHAGAAK